MAARARASATCAGSGTIPDIASLAQQKELIMNGVIYLIGLVVVVLAVLSFLGLS
jgi:hypothetical protein